MKHASFSVFIATHYRNGQKLEQLGAGLEEAQCGNSTLAEKLSVFGELNYRGKKKRHDESTK